VRERRTEVLIVGGGLGGMAIRSRLDAGNGLLFRYLPRESPDGLPGDEGAFLLCSFWLVDNLALQGRRDEASTLYESLCRRSGVLGLLPEQLEPSTGEFLGNYPQALSHVGLISTGVLLDRLARGEHFRTASTASQDLHGAVEEVAR
jgi:GH15 family glucan-1,4-alpha-glucosidase